MKALQDDVRKFNEAIGTPMRSTPGPITNKDQDMLAHRLVAEEWKELHEAWAYDDIPGMGDALCDLIYVAVGMACRLGIDLAPLWAEVQRTNMAKVGGPVRADGKQEKPMGWQPPRIAELLQAQGWRP